jgi:hypothetical protein
MDKVQHHLDNVNSRLITVEQGGSKAPRMQPPQTWARRSVNVLPLLGMSWRTLPMPSSKRRQKLLVLRSPGDRPADDVHPVCHTVEDRPTPKRWDPLPAPKDSSTPVSFPILQLCSLRYHKLLFLTFNGKKDPLPRGRIIARSSSTISGSHEWKGVGMHLFI